MSSVNDSFKSTVRAAAQLCGKAKCSIHMLFPRREARFKGAKSLKLNIGCGNVKFSGWVDIEPGADIVVDVRTGLPLDAGCANFIYSEHFIEHLSFEEGEKVIKEFHRCLGTCGILRIATPNLDYLMEKYNKGWKEQDWLLRPEYNFIKTKGQMINVCFSWWGHKFLYNEEDLTAQLSKAGFRKIVRCEIGKSMHVPFVGLETRKDSKLILEAEK